MDTRTEIREFLTSRPRARDFYHHPVVGELSLNFERLELAADLGLTIFAYTAEPSSRDEEALKLLGSWAATLDQADATVLDPAGDT